MKTTILVVAVAALLFASLASAAPGMPDFTERVYADGVAWGTKVTGVIRNPNYNSLDKFYIITNSNNPGVQLPVGEAAPGNPMYNGGRWWTHTVTWTQSGFDAHGTVPILMSQDDIDLHAGLGHLEIVEGSPPDGPPDFFRCPLLPVKDGGGVPVR